MKTATNIALSCVAGLLACACVMNSNQTAPTDTLTNTSANSPAAAMPQKAGQATPLMETNLTIMLTKETIEKTATHNSYN